MKKVPFCEFQRLMKPIEKYEEEYNDTADGLNLLCKDSYVSPSLGTNLLDNYIDLLEGYLEMDNDWLNWFVFENDMGKANRSIFNEKDIEFKISCLEDLYNFLTNLE